MKTYSPERWADWCQGTWHGEPPASLAGVSLDSRRIRPGELFIAIRSEQRDGHDFLQSAFEQGAAAALVERGKAIPGYACLEVVDTRRALSALGHQVRKSFAGKVIGITGSCGKTSTKEILKTLCGERVWATPGNLNNDLGLPISLLFLNDEEHDVGIFELGINHVGEMRGLAEVLQPDYGLVTNVAAAHLEGMGSLENVANEKIALLEQVSQPSRCYFPASCLAYAAYRTLGGQVVRREGENLLSGDFVVHQYTPLTGEGSSEIRLLGVAESFRLNSTGPGMISNAVLAIVLALDLGVAPEQIRRRLRSWTPTMMRAQWKEWKRIPVFVDCYNSNPHSLNEAGVIFEHRTAAYPQRLWVLGGMGELGEESGRWHAEAASRLPVRSGDTILAIGEEALGFKQGLRTTEKKGPEWIHVNHAEEGRQIVQAHEGPLFFKGSRRFALETLLPEGLQDPDGKLPRKAPDTETGD